MNTIYSLRILAPSGELRTGMYVSGAAAVSPELAKQVLDTPMFRQHRNDRLVVVSREREPGTWSDSAGNAHQRWSNPVVVEVEPEPGAWGDIVPLSMSASG